MLEVAPEKLGGTVEIDETFVGGKARRWRPYSDKSVVVSLRQRNGDLRLIRAADRKIATLRKLIGFPNLQYKHLTAKVQDAA
jgi:hypothetical protein